ncbi:MAG: hypothetical protein C4526_00220 [Nitrospiraceae bacterium]|nr:MAG: hypothetical protein C4526_00220 [Nitrospiraceae bacterium]
MNPAELKKIYENMSTSELERILYIENKEKCIYTQESIKVIQDILLERNDRTIGITEKICPYCNKFVSNTLKICECGYDFEFSNEDDLNYIHNKKRSLERKRGLKNSLFGVVLIIITVPVVPMLSSHTFLRTLFVILFWTGMILIIRGIYQALTAKKFRFFKNMDIFSDEEDKFELPCNIPDSYPKIKIDEFSNLHRIQWRNPQINLSPYLEIEWECAYCGADHPLSKDDVSLEGGGMRLLTECSNCGEQSIIKIKRKGTLNFQLVTEAGIINEP